MSLAEQILSTPTVDWQLQLSTGALQLLTSCWDESFRRNVENLERNVEDFDRNAENLVDCFRVQTASRVKRDENVMKKIVDAYGEVIIV
jgi:hypothetical protein